VQFSRRDLLLGSLATSMLAHLPQATVAEPDAQALKAGQFVWEPERSASGAVLVIVSIPEQMLHVYRGGIEIGVSSCSTGKPGHRTPTGVFTILEKERKHVSSIYKGAQMPNMERLTWTGIAIHAGNLPGFPASHGCIRLPLKFSALLYEVTQLGAAVIVADAHTQPASMVHPGLLLPSVAKVEADAVVERLRQKSEGWQTVIHYPTTSVLISRADAMAYVTTDGRPAGEYPSRFAEASRQVGTHVYSLLGPAADGSGLLWLAVGLGKSPHEAHVVEWQGDKVLRRISFADMRRAREIAESFRPGTLLMVTDAPAPRSTRETAKDFKLISSEPDA
jgi:hypothetical protein